MEYESVNGNGTEKEPMKREFYFCTNCKKIRNPRLITSFELPTAMLPAYTEGAGSMAVDNSCASIGGERGVN
jgi:hypothetical protein